MQHKHILTDCDGCLVNWEKSFSEFMSARGYTKTPEHEHEYNLSLRYSIPGRTAQTLVTEFNESDRIKTLEPFADSVEYVAKLVQQGFSFTVITSLSSSATALKNRTENLVNIFGNVFEDIICIEQGASKAATLAAWVDTGYYWIEDHMRQAEAGHEVGLRTILIEHPHNLHYKTDLFPSVSHTTPWKEIYDTVCAEYKLEP